MTDPVNSPDHYKGKRWECIEIIETFGLDFHRGNALKYIARHKQKGGEQDIKKARWYLRRALGNPILLAQMASGIPTNYSLAKVMRGSAIADNFDINDEDLRLAISALRDSCESASSETEVRKCLADAVHFLTSYLATCYVTTTRVSDNA